MIVVCFILCTRSTVSIKFWRVFVGRQVIIKSRTEARRKLPIASTSRSQSQRRRRRRRRPMFWRWSTSRTRRLLVSWSPRPKSRRVGERLPSPAANDGLLFVFRLLAFFWFAFTYGRPMRPFLRTSCPHFKINHTRAAGRFLLQRGSDRVFVNSLSRKQCVRRDRSMKG